MLLSTEHPPPASHSGIEEYLARRGGGSRTFRPPPPWARFEPTAASRPARRGDSLSVRLYPHEETDSVWRLIDEAETRSGKLARTEKENSAAAMRRRGGTAPYKVGWQGTEVLHLDLRQSMGSSRANQAHREIEKTAGVQ